MSAPKLFISYSWSSAEHEQWVVDLATELRESGIDVILDKWDLKEGNDAVAFMEQMVTDPTIKKVLIVSDAQYAAKADGRAGGVGTETQIISREVYEHQAQEKFVAVVSEKDEDGQPLLPTYYKSRIYIDLSTADRYAEQFERLVRWAFDKPRYVKPNLGVRPPFLSESDHVSLGTTAIFKRCIDAIRTHKTFAAGAFEEFSTSFASHLERYRLVKSDEMFDDVVVSNIADFIPFRNEAVQLLVAVAQYSPTTDFIELIHRLFENLIPYMNKPANVYQWNDFDFDNFRFLVHELFLYALAILLKHDRLDQANYLLERPYYLPNNAEFGRDVIAGFTVLREHMRSLACRNDRLKLGRLSVRADMLEERCNGTGIAFHHLQQADFVAFMRAELEQKDRYKPWWPETLVDLEHVRSPFEIFGRAVSKAYFDRAKVLLAIDTPDDLEPLFKSYQNGSRTLPRWQFAGFNPAALLGYDRLATRP
jgi:hypothetical protein